MATIRITDGQDAQVELANDWNYEPRYPLHLPTDFSLGPFTAYYTGELPHGPVILEPHTFTTPIQMPEELLGYPVIVRRDDVATRQGSWVDLKSNEAECLRLAETILAGAHKADSRVERDAAKIKMADIRGRLDQVRQIWDGVIAALDAEDATGVRRGYDNPNFMSADHFYHPARNAIEYLRAYVAVRGVNNTPLPPTSELQAELLALGEEFGNLEWDSRNKLVRVTTGPVSLIQPETMTEPVNFGPMQIALKYGQTQGLWSLGSSGNRYCEKDVFFVTAAEPVYRRRDRTSFYHPHVAVNGAVCTGEHAKRSIRLALQQGRLMDAFMVLRSVLETYNSGSPYAQLETWHGNFQPCVDCGNQIDTEGSSGIRCCHILQRRTPEERFCNNWACRETCGKQCRTCGVAYCPKCGGPRGGCPRCAERKREREQEKKEPAPVGQAGAEQQQQQHDARPVYVVTVQEPVAVSVAMPVGEQTIGRVTITDEQPVGIFTGAPSGWRDGEHRPPPWEDPSDDYDDEPDHEEDGEEDEEAHDEEVASDPAVFGYSGRRADDILHSFEDY